MSDLVGDYLADLQKALPRPMRRDVVAEIEDHLRESASTNGPEEAVARFGPAHDLALLFAVQLAVRDVRRAARLLLLAILPFVIAVCPLPRGLLPAWGAASLDRWPEQLPVAWLQDVILVLLCVSAVFAFMGIAVAESRRLRLGLLLHVAALLSIIAFGTMVTVLAVQWESAFPSAPSPIWVAIYVFISWRR